MIGQHMCRCLAQLGGARVWAKKRRKSDAEKDRVVAIVFCDAQSSALTTADCQISESDSLVCLEARFNLEDAPPTVAKCTRAAVVFYALGQPLELLCDARVQLNDLNYGDQNTRMPGAATIKTAEAAGGASLSDSEPQSRPGQKPGPESNCEAATAPTPDSMPGPERMPPSQFLVAGKWLSNPTTKENVSTSKHVMLNRHTAKPPVSLSFEMLRSLIKYSVCLADLQATAESARFELNKLGPRSRREHQLRLDAAKLKLEQVQDAKAVTIAKIARLQMQKVQIEQRRAEADQRLNGSIKEVAELAKRAEMNLQQQQEVEKAIALSVMRERRRAVLKLMTIFPIETASNSFHFTIAGVLLPSAFEIDHFDHLQVGAALGFVAHLVLVLSKLTCTPLPFEVHPFGSRSFISDHLCTKSGKQVFPLWTKGVLLYRVEYALYLLHRDIERLMLAQDLPVVDIKHTLANLRTLMLVLSQPDSKKAIPKLEEDTEYSDKVTSAKNKPTEARTGKVKLPPKTQTWPASTKDRHAEITPAN